MIIAMMEPTAMPAIAPVESPVGLGDCVAGADGVAVGLSDLVPEVSEAIAVNVVAVRSLSVERMVVSRICDEVPGPNDDISDPVDKVVSAADEDSGSADDISDDISDPIDKVVAIVTVTSRATLTVEWDILVCLKPLEGCMEWTLRCCFAR